VCECVEERGGVLLADSDPFACIGISESEKKQQKMSLGSL